MKGQTGSCLVMAMSNVLNALIAIQRGLKAPKDQSAGRYRYRNIEDVNEAVKPLAASCGCAVVYSDVFTDDGRCVSTCRLISDGGEISATGVTYVNRQPKNMSIEQSCGSASSYARKYAACGLFAIDSSKDDPDRVNAKPTRFAKLSALKEEAIELGIKEEGLKGWMEANILQGRTLRDVTDDELAQIESHIEGLIEARKQLNG